MTKPDSSWLTWEQFKQLGKTCKKCDKPAKWLPLDGNWDCYCDEHFPYEKQKEEEYDTR